MSPPGPGRGARARHGHAPGARRHCVDEMGAFSTSCAGRGMPLRFLGRVLWFAPVVLLAKLVMGSFDRRASMLGPDLRQPRHLFFASVCLSGLPLVRLVGRARSPSTQLLVSDPALDLPGVRGHRHAALAGLERSRRRRCGSHVHFAQLEAFAVVREGAEPIIVVPKRMPRALGDGDDRQVPRPRRCVRRVGRIRDGRYQGIIRPGDRVRVRGSAWVTSRTSRASRSTAPPPRS